MRIPQTKTASVFPFVRPIFLSLIATLISVTTFSADEARAATEGKPAPEFSVQTTAGETVSLRSAAGQVIILHIWATWCGPCQIEMPVLNHYYETHHHEGLRFVAISADDTKDTAKAVEKMKSFSFDSALLKNADVKKFGRLWRLPLTFVIDRNGVLIKDGWVMNHTIEPSDLETVVTPLLRVKAQSVVK